MSRIIGGKKYTKGQIRRLKRHVCRLCEQRLDQDFCGSIFLPHAERCPPELLAKKRDECIAASRRLNAEAS